MEDIDIVLPCWASSNPTRAQKRNDRSMANKEILMKDRIIFFLSAFIGFRCRHPQYRSALGRKDVSFLIEKSTRNGRIILVGNSISSTRLQGWRNIIINSDFPLNRWDFVCLFLFFFQLTLYLRPYINKSQIVFWMKLPFGWESVISSEQCKNKREFLFWFFFYFHSGF